MPQLTRRRLLTGGLAAPALSLITGITTGLPAWAARQPYTIDAETSEIKFLFDLGGLIQTGTAPLLSADLSIDPGDLAASEADVTADLTQARTGLILATQALKSAAVLNTDAHPTARFKATKVLLGRTGRLSEGAALEGDLTLRGVTRPIRFDAAVFRPAGSAPDDLSRLDIHLTGAIQRFDYGADGYPGLVADRVGLDIRARIKAV